MKIIELIYKIQNNEELPKIIKYDNVIWELNKDVKDYYFDEWLISDYLGRTELNEFIYDEIEIISEEEIKPIEEIKMCCSGIMGFDGVENICSVLKDKLNELIKEINKIKKENRE